MLVERFGIFNHEVVSVNPAFFFVHRPPVANASFRFKGVKIMRGVREKPGPAVGAVAIQCATEFGVAVGALPRVGQ